MPLLNVGYRLGLVISVMLALYVGAILFFSRFQLHLSFM